MLHVGYLHMTLKCGRKRVAFVTISQAIWMRPLRCRWASDCWPLVAATPQEILRLLQTQTCTSTVQWNERDNISVLPKVFLVLLFYLEFSVGCAIQPAAFSVFFFIARSPIRFPHPSIRLVMSGLIFVLNDCKPGGGVRRRGKCTVRRRVSGILEGSCPRGGGLPPGSPNLHVSHGGPQGTGLFCHFFPPHPGPKNEKNPHTGYL